MSSKYVTRWIRWDDLLAEVDAKIQTDGFLARMADKKANGNISIVEEVFCTIVASDDAAKKDFLPWMKRLLTASATNADCNNAAVGSPVAS